MERDRLPENFVDLLSAVFNHFLWWVLMNNDLC